MALQTTLAAAKRGWHAVLMPSHMSSRSQGLPPIAGKQIVPPGRGVAPGHAAPDPVQMLADEQEPGMVPPHWVPGDANASLGQEPLTPLHVSTMSQPPADMRQRVPFGRTMLSGHDLVTPSQ